jgi:hypothetical protein
MEEHKAIHLILRSTTLPKAPPIGCMPYHGQYMRVRQYSLCKFTVARSQFNDARVSHPKLPIGKNIDY